MHPHTKFAIFTLKYVGCMYISRYVKVTVNKILSKPNNVGNMLGIRFFKNWGQRSRPQWNKAVCNIPLPQYVSLRWDLYVIYHKRYALYIFLIDQWQRPRSQWPQNSMLQSTTQICIQTRNLGRYALDTSILALRPEVKVTAAAKMVRNTLHPKIQPHIKFGIPTFNSIDGT